MTVLAAGASRRRVAYLISLVALLGCFVVQLLGAQLPNTGLLIAATACGLALDLALRKWHTAPLSTLARLRCDEIVRQLTRDLLTVAATVQVADVDGAAGVLLVAGLLACYATHFVIRGLAVLVRRTRTLPLLTRNIDTSALSLSAAPPPLVIKSGQRMLLFSAPATAGMLTTVATDRAVWGLVGVGVSLALFLGAAVYLATWLLPGKRPPSEARVEQWFERWLAEYRPDVGLYFSGGSTTAYQANMWLTTLAALEGRPLIVLRERGMMQLIAATDVPIVCLPRVAHLMMLEHSTLSVLLHPANAPKTSQVLRIPTIKHAFTNHGESDKLSSCNPYAKVYDEVWVAGPAARRRYALADVGVDDRDVVEVGRPQLAPIRPAAGPPPAEGPVTVLYAPTWEGWTNDPGNTSLILAGENIVRALLADPRVRLLYKPHPMTGSVDPRAGAADRAIRAIIAEANASASPAAGEGTEAAELAARERQLARRTVELDELTSTAFRRSSDEMERMGLQGAPEPGRAQAVAAATEAWRTAFWAARPARAHMVLDGPRPDIYSCFNQADLLISDVSSVVSDFLASAKPYAVANTSGLPEAEFRAANPTVRAATILTPDATGVSALLDAVVDPALDRLADERAELKEYLLGPAEPPSLVRFRAATRALRAKAEARAARQTAGAPDAADTASLTTRAGAAR
ncbi:hypothetical protein ACTWP5_12255 [Streptomyces sp. 4N509B]|uniref:hypothetical protein n=1 Tax=Streptomyces sp. 4N509B TaxID=3457413 RepID=UPI003FD68C31